MKVVEINFLDIEENKEYENTINKVVEKCFEEENLQNKNLCVILNNRAGKNPSPVGVGTPEN